MVRLFLGNVSVCFCAGDKSRRFDTFEQATVAGDGKLHSIHEDADSENSVTQNGVLEIAVESKFDIIITSNVSNANILKKKKTQKQKLTGNQTDKIALPLALDALSPSGYIICSRDLEQSITQESMLEIINEPVQQASAILIGRQRSDPVTLKTQARQIVLVSLFCNWYDYDTE